MAKKKWPKVNRTGKPVQTFVSEETFARLQQLTEQTGRPMAEEVRHAIERHLAQPPRVVAEPLVEVTVSQRVSKSSKAPAATQDATDEQPAAGEVEASKPARAHGKKKQQTNS
jgi:hypothetical protein